MRPAAPIPLRKVIIPSNAFFENLRPEGFCLGFIPTDRPGPFFVAWILAISNPRYSTEAWNRRDRCLHITMLN